MLIEKLKKLKKAKRHQRLRRRIKGTAERPRLFIQLGHKHIRVQIIDDIKQQTLLSLATFDKAVKTQFSSAGNVNAAKMLGEILSNQAKEKSIKKVVLDRGHHPYHGRVKAFAEAMRTGGIEL